MKCIHNRNNAINYVSFVLWPLARPEQSESLAHKWMRVGQWEKELVLEGLVMALTF